jgi:hypothetical protein
MHYLNKINLYLKHLLIKYYLGPYNAIKHEFDVKYND